VLGERDQLHYIRNWKTANPEITTLRTNLGRQRKIEVSYHGSKNEQKVKISYSLV